MTPSGPPTFCILLSWCGSSVGWERAQGTALRRGGTELRSLVMKVQATGLHAPLPCTVSHEHLCSDLMSFKNPDCERLWVVL